MDLAGKKFGNYRAVSLLGEGGFGSVYLAEHPLMARKAAVKVLREARAADLTFLNRFFNEARAASAINHPNIVEIFDAGVSDDGTPYLLMELLTGETLKGRIARVGALPLATALAFAGECASALAAAHRAGIVHRDFKPENIFVTRDAADKTGGREQVKVLDFGIAKLIGFGTANVVRTETGTFMGSPRYMSPEQWLGTGTVDHRTDIYALGAVLFEMLTGAPPFDAQDLPELRHQHLFAPVPALADRGMASTPPGMEALLARALAKEAEARFATVEEMGTALARLVVPAATAVHEVQASGRRSPQALPVVDRPATRTTLTASSGERLFEAEAGAHPATGARGGRLLRKGIMAGLGAALAAGGLWFTLGRPAPSAPAAQVKQSQPGETAPTTAVIPPVPASPAPSTSAEAAAAAAPAAAATVELRIRSRPSGATVMDEGNGAVLGQTPLELRFPAGSEPHRVRLTRRGYRPASVATSASGTGDDGKSGPAQSGTGPPALRTIHKDIKLELAPPRPTPAAPPQGDIVL